MIFAFATDDRSLEAFANEADAVACCEGIDVASGGYQFFGPNGSPLQAIFTVEPKTSGFVVTNGVYHLQSCDGATLQQVLPLVASVEGQGLRTPEQVASVLTLRSSGPPAASAELKR